MSGKVASVSTIGTYFVTVIQGQDGVVTPLFWCIITPLLADDSVALVDGAVASKRSSSDGGASEHY